jgi:hypothetical protein
MKEDVADYVPLLRGGLMPESDKEGIHALVYQEFGNVDIYQSNSVTTRLRLFHSSWSVSVFNKIKPDGKVLFLNFVPNIGNKSLPRNCNASFLFP